MHKLVAVRRSDIFYPHLLIHTHLSVSLKKENIAGGGCPAQGA